MLKEGTKNLTVVIDKDLHKRIMVKSAEEGVKITTLIRDFLVKWAGNAKGQKT